MLQNRFQNDSNFKYPSGHPKDGDPPYHPQHKNLSQTVSIKRESILNVLITEYNKLKNVNIIILSLGINTI